MPYKIIIFLFVSFSFYGNCYADCSGEERESVFLNCNGSGYSNGILVGPKAQFIFLTNVDKCMVKIKYAQNEITAIYLTSGHGQGCSLIKDGPSIVWYENGQKHSEWNMSNNKMTGLKTIWHKNGVKQSEANYKDNVINGVETIWNDRGEKISEIEYINGLRKTDQSSFNNDVSENSSQDPIEIAKDICKKLGFKEKTEKYGICVLKNIN